MTSDSNGGIIHPVLQEEYKRTAVGWHFSGGAIYTDKEAKLMANMSQDDRKQVHLWKTVLRGELIDE